MSDDILTGLRIGGIAIFEGEKTDPGYRPGFMGRLDD
jgi:hypothetical protein